jgi:hypothetical protein
VAHGDPDAVSAALERSAVLRARLKDLYAVVEETVRTSHEVCDVASKARARAHRVVSGKL